MTIRCSLNEIQLYGLRAARASGMAWGLAEEAGRAARWLAARGLPGAQLLLSLLQRNDGRAYADIAPKTATDWQARGGVLCPICTGCALADRLASLEAPPRLGVTASPALLLPFLDTPGRGGRQLAVSWQTAALVIGPAGLSLRADGGEALCTQQTPAVRISVAHDEELGRQLPPSVGSVAVPDSTWQLLQAFAQRTYVPASERSRLSGAGAGDSDND